MPNSREKLLNRPRGILTEQDREYLFGLGESPVDEKPDQTDYQRRYRIRERVKNGIIDFMLLSTSLPRKDMHKIFSDVEGWADARDGVIDVGEALAAGEEPTQEEVPNLEAASSVPLEMAAWRHLFYFYWMALRPSAGVEPLRMALTEGLRSAIQTSALLNGEGFLTDVEVRLEVEGNPSTATPLDEIEELPTDPLVREPLLALLVEEGRLTPEEAVELF